VSDRSLRLGVGALAVVGIAIAGYLSWARAAGETLACPVSGGGCETVQQSSYSELAGVPVAYLGLAMYVVVLALVVWDSEPARAATAALALAGTAFAVYLLAVMAFVIDAVCVWCLASDATVAAIAALATWRFLRATPSEPDAAPSARSGRGSPSGSRPSP
jgi:uncharacterized membrane protein